MNRIHEGLEDKDFGKCRQVLRKQVSALETGLLRVQAARLSQSTSVFQSSSRYAIHTSMKAVMITMKAYYNEKIQTPTQQQKQFKRCS